ncbi:hypothetical protein PUT24_17760 [Streptomyces sp. SP17KL33]|nr:hypothetical protein [Streptomyces sp. SP17KL33]
MTDAERVTLAVAQAVLGFHCEARWLRFAHTHLQGVLPFLHSVLPKRLDDVWIVDPTAVECACSRETRQTLRPGRPCRLRLLSIPSRFY